MKHFIGLDVSLAKTSVCVISEFGKIIKETEVESETALAFVIGETLTHDEIIAWYANQIFLGQTCFGVADASMAYFEKPAEDLTTEEAAYLAALPKAPAHFHPVRSYDRALERRNFVLAEMQSAEFLSETEAAQARQTDLLTKDPLGRCEPR